jgi:hypothetical protein
MLEICNMRDTKDGLVSMAGLESGTLGHCRASIAARKRAQVAQGDASSPITSVDWIRQSVQERLLVTMHRGSQQRTSQFIHTRRAGYSVYLVGWPRSVAQLVQELKIQTQRADRYVYHSSSSYRLQ